MRILLVNKYYFLHSGTERYLFNLKRLLEAHGHTVAVFAMHHPRNPVDAYAQYFLPWTDFHALKPFGQARAALRSIWNPLAARRFAALLDDFRPDIAHLLNIYHHISPSILPQLARRGIPAVQTLNDYKLVCPNYQLYTHGQECRRCLDGRYWRAARYRCLHGSLAWSLVGALEMTLHKAWKIYARGVRAFIAPSAYLQQAVQQAGVPAAQTALIPYFLFPGDYAPHYGEGEYILYAGRLSAEKGLPALLHAMQRLPQAELRIAGDGPQRQALQALAARLRLKNVRFLGHLPGEELQRVLADARLNVLPSLWPEVFGQSVIEAFALARPSAVALSGGLPEVVDASPQGDGWLFPPGDVAALAACLQQAMDDPLAARQKGERGLEKVHRVYNPHTHYQQLSNLYQSL